jgi:succinate-acetate transporter protein
MLGEFLGSTGLHAAGGWVGIITALLAWYAAYKGVEASLA